jgi:hypothetical protein
MDRKNRWGEVRGWREGTELPLFTDLEEVKPERTNRCLGRISVARKIVMCLECGSDIFPSCESPANRKSRNNSSHSKRII